MSNSFEISKEGYLYRSYNEVIFEDEEINEDGYEKLLKISKNEKDFEVTRNEIEKDENGNICSQNSAWFLLKLSKMDKDLNKYKIHQGEIIKIGRIITRIREIKYGKNKANNKEEINSLNNSSKYSNNKFMLRDIDEEFLIQKKDTQVNIRYHEKLIDMANQKNATDANFSDRIQVLSLNNNINNNYNELNSSTKKTISFRSKTKKVDKICRICYLEEEDEKENPIVQPCHCSGSCKYIHLKCLKQWIMNKSCLKIDHYDLCSIFLFTESECELCKAKLPDFVNHNGKLISLLDFSDEFENYLILESLTLDKENNKFLYIISLDKNREIKVGRGQVCDILLSDVSVSRIHCFLVINGKNVYIQDNDSKFGTLVLIQTPTIKLIEGLPLNIQIGRSFLKLLIKKESKFFGCCGISENLNVLEYYQQNQKQIETERVFTVKTEFDESEEIINKSEFDEIKEDEKKRSDIEEYVNEIVI
jgi:hypothetical protein